MAINTIRLDLATLPDHLDCLRPNAGRDLRDLIGAMDLGIAAMGRSRSRGQVSIWLGAKTRSFGWLPCGEGRASQCALDDANVRFGLRDLGNEKRPRGVSSRRNSSMIKG
jgi:hypothetical protein